MEIYAKKRQKGRIPMKINGLGTDIVLSRRTTSGAFCATALGARRSAVNETSKKKRRNVNALQHGLYAKDILLPWDSHEDFERLFADLKAELSPHGRAEEEAVLDLAVLHHQKHTVWRMRQSVVLRDPFTRAIQQTGAKSWRGIRKRLRAEAKETRNLQGMAEAGMADLQAQCQRMERQIEKASDADEIALLEKKIAANRRFLAGQIETIYVGTSARNSFDKAYVPESMENLVRLEAAIDARIAKVLGRLVALKEFKRTPAGGATPTLEHV